ncbi:hypothetical protein [Acidocella sp.]|uniref:hypothetical protein n=1 Tax=Acidocella sp. TaxID=50710 RepID=UPI0026215C25|nr:hypothetical protein [Acidocella sp.]MDD2795310.1 hypothetical protein [Acidocella sp.]
MAFKVNYGLERAERNRAKQAKKEAKAKAKKRLGEVAGDEQPAAELPVGEAPGGDAEQA